MWNYILAVLIGATIPLITLWFQSKEKKKYFEMERKEKLKMVAIEKRLEAHQQALKHWNQLRSVIHEKDFDKRNNTIKSATDFWYSNCLYLEKNTRNKFYEVIYSVSMYPEYLAIWRESPKGPEKERSNVELKSQWDEISSLSSVIMAEVELQPIVLREEFDLFGKKKNK